MVTGQSILSQSSSEQAKSEKGMSGICLRVHVKRLGTSNPLIKVSVFKIDVAAMFVHDKNME